MSDEPDLIPYSARRRRHELELRLPQDRTAEEDLNAVSDEAIRRASSGASPNLGFPSWKGRRHV